MKFIELPYDNFIYVYRKGIFMFFKVIADSKNTIVSLKEQLNAIDSVFEDHSFDGYYSFGEDWVQSGYLSNKYLVIKNTINLYKRAKLFN